MTVGLPCQMSPAQWLYQLRAWWRLQLWLPLVSFLRLWQKGFELDWQMRLWQRCSRDAAL